MLAGVQTYKGLIPPIAGYEHLSPDVLFPDSWICLYTILLLFKFLVACIAFLVAILLDLIYACGIPM